MKVNYKLCLFGILIVSASRDMHALVTIIGNFAFPYFHYSLQWILMKNRVVSGLVFA